MQTHYRIEEVVDVATVPAGFPVRFCLLTDGDRQYVAYYDDQHRMTVAARTVDSHRWRTFVLPSKVGWDSHNYVTMALDADGHLHLSGNMHCDGLVYFRTTRPGEINSFERVASMTGRRENACTYPRFLRDAEGRLVFKYRDGGSGNGVEVFNVYDPPTKTWTPLLEEPLLDGGGEMNAYPLGPVRGPDGRFHLVWVWRDTPDCATNHHLSYARSADLTRWESAAGVPVETPMTIDERSLWVDPAPSGGGMINGGQRLAFDAADRPVLAYHKADADGAMQVYVAAFRDGRWVRRVVTDWETPVVFGGRGSMPFIGIRIGPLRRIGDDRFALGYRHRDYGRGRLFIDAATLQPAAPVECPPEVPPALDTPQRDIEGMNAHVVEDLGAADAPGVRYVLRWETLGSNHDRPRTEPPPPPSTLTVCKLLRQTSAR